MATTARRDKAIAAAHFWLDGRICECGAHINDHRDAVAERAVHQAGGVFIPSLMSTFGIEQYKVKCRAFRPVSFLIRRAKY